MQRYIHRSCVSRAFIRMTIRTLHHHNNYIVITILTLTVLIHVKKKTLLKSFRSDSWYSVLMNGLVGVTFFHIFGVSVEMFVYIRAYHQKLTRCQYN